MVFKKTKRFLNNIKKLKIKSKIKKNKLNNWKRIMSSRNVFQRNNQKKKKP